MHSHSSVLHSLLPAFRLPIYSRFALACLQTGGLSGPIFSFFGERQSHGGFHCPPQPLFAVLFRFAFMRRLVGVEELNRLEKARHSQREPTGCVPRQAR